MGLLAFSICVAMAGYALPGAALAEPKKKPDLEDFVPTGSHVRQAPDKVEGRAQGRMIDALANCARSRVPSRVDYYIRNSDDLSRTSEIDNVAKYLRLPTCLGRASSFGSLGSQARFSDRNLRAWLTEEVYLKENDEFVPLAEDATPPPEREYFSVRRKDLAITLGTFADCLILRDAVGADALLRTDRGSPEERSAAHAMVPALSGCLPQGTTLSFTPKDIRTYSASGLWQRYEAAKPPSYEVRP